MQRTPTRETTKKRKTGAGSTPASWHSAASSPDISSPKKQKNKVSDIPQELAVLKPMQPEELVEGLREVFAEPEEKSEDVQPLRAFKLGKVPSIFCDVTRKVRMEFNAFREVFTDYRVVYVNFTVNPARHRLGVFVNSVNEREYSMGFSPSECSYRFMLYEIDHAGIQFLYVPTEVFESARFYLHSFCRNLVLYRDYRQEAERQLALSSTLYRVDEKTNSVVRTGVNYQTEVDFDGPFGYSSALRNIASQKTTKRT